MRRRRKDDLFDPGPQDTEATVGHVDQTIFIAAKDQRRATRHHGCLTGHHELELLLEGINSLTMLVARGERRSPRHPGLATDLGRREQQLEETPVPQRLAKACSPQLCKLSQGVRRLGRQRTRCGENERTRAMRLL